MPTKLTGSCAGPLVVTANEVTIDMKGFSIVCANADSDETGILLENREAVTIRNGSVRCSKALVIRGGGAHSFSKLYLGDPNLENARAIQVLQSEDNVFTNVVADGGSDGRALLLEAADGNKFEKVQFTSSEFVGATVDGNSNRFTNSVFFTIFGPAALSIAGQGNVFEGNQVRGTVEVGIEIEGSGNILRKNVVQGALLGINVKGESHTLDRNSASGMDYGIVAGGRGHLVDRNTCVGNAIADLSSIVSPCAENVWRKNVFSVDSEGDGPTAGCIR